MNLQGFGFQPLKGALRSTSAVSVSRNWHITVGFEDGDPGALLREDVRGRHRAARRVRNPGAT
jgi:hypothetical protein